MPYGDGIDRKHCFSITDFHNFEECSFNFFVSHHLGLAKKYEIAEGSFQLALGSLLDETIKKFHKQSLSGQLTVQAGASLTASADKNRLYGQPPEMVAGIVRSCASDMLEKAQNQSGPSFYSAIKPFLNEELYQKATEVFINYYKALDYKIKEQVLEPGFCEWIIEGEGRKWKLWGGPDSIERGDDGMPEVCDYKSREALAFHPEEAQNDKSREKAEKAKENIDMDLMPKIYMLLCCKKLQDAGYKRARFVVRFWQDPNENSFAEEFDLETVSDYQKVFEDKIKDMLENSKLTFCEKSFCKACTSEKRVLFVKELENKKIVKSDLGDFFAPV